jgi:hypothetical protein
MQAAGTDQSDRHVSLSRSDFVQRFVSSCGTLSRLLTEKYSPTAIDVTSREPRTNVYLAQMDQPMSARILFEVAMRVMGVWLFVSAISDLMSQVSLVYSVIVSGQMLADAMNYIMPSAVALAVRLLMSGALILGAPRAAKRFYPQMTEDQEMRIAVGPGDMYRTACFVLGAYFLVRTAEPAGRLVAAGFAGMVWHVDQLANALTVMVYTASGILLVFGSRKISEMLSHLGYDPDTIPAQRFSIAMLLILLVLIAIILGVIRFISHGGV